MLSCDGASTPRAAGLAVQPLINGPGVTRPGVSVSVTLCCFVSVCVLWQTGLMLQLRAHTAASSVRTTCVCSVIETLWSQLHLLCRANVALCKAAAKNRV